MSLKISFTCASLRRSQILEFLAGRSWNLRFFLFPAYCTLRNEMKRNEICTLPNENLYFAN